MKINLVIVKHPTFVMSFKQLSVCLCNVCYKKQRNNLTLMWSTYICYIVRFLLDEYCVQNRINRNNYLFKCSFHLRCGNVKVKNNYSALYMSYFLKNKFSTTVKMRDNVNLKNGYSVCYISYLLRNNAITTIKTCDSVYTNVNGYNGRVSRRFSGCYLLM